jgi:FkbM family methyltransferase
MNPRTWVGEGLRWYLKRARHPFKDYVVGHYWSWFSTPRIWVKYDGNAAIGVRIGDYLQKRIFYDGYYEQPLVDWLKRSLKSDDVFWDVGANIGAISLVAAKLCRTVVAFEPDPRSIESLTQNIKVNHISNVEIVAAALGAQAGSATLYQAAPLNSGMTSIVAGRGNVVGNTAVTVMRADEFVARRPDLAPTVMKIDVEGAEDLVLEGAARLLRTGTVRAIVFEDRRDADTHPTNQDLVARLRDADYAIQPFGASDIHDDDGMYNFLAVPAAGV